MSKRYIIPIFVPHYGCPHDCIFCNQKKITNISTSTTPEEVEGIIEQYLEYFWKDNIIEVAFYGGSFTAIDMDVQSKLLEIPYKYKEKGIINEIRVSTRPDTISREILDNLKGYKVDTIELGIQSLDEDVLFSSNRGHNVKDVYDSANLIKEYGFNLGLQMMVGLPKDNIYKCIMTAKEFIKMKPDVVRIYPTLVIKDTYLKMLYDLNEYKALALDEAIEICTVLLIIFYLNDVNVIRVGLQATENIQMGMDVVSGPFHPAFRQLVEANIYKIALDDYLSKIDLKEKKLMIKANKSIISNIAGQKSNNIIFLKDKFGFNKISLYPENLEKDNIIIQIGPEEIIVDMRIWMEDYIKKIN